LCIETFPPTKDFEDYLREYVNNIKCASYPQPPILPSKEGISDAEERIKLMSFYCERRLLQRLSNSTTFSPRLLSKEEVNHLRVAPFSPWLIGYSLQELLDRQRAAGNESPVPQILVQLVSVLKDMRASTIEGIFRLSAEAARVGQLRVVVENGSFSPQKWNAHEVACLLKLWLSELPDPIINARIYEDCIKSRDDPRRVTQILKDLTSTLEGTVLRYIVEFLQELGAPTNVKQTKMTLNNLATVFSPLFLRCPYDDPATILQNTEYETAFVLSLLQHWRR